MKDRSPDKKPRATRKKKLYDLSVRIQDARTGEENFRAANLIELAYIQFYDFDDKMSAAKYCVQQTKLTDFYSVYFSLPDVLAKIAERRPVFSLDTGALTTVANQVEGVNRYTLDGSGRRKDMFNSMLMCWDRECTVNPKHQPVLSCSRCRRV